MSTRTTRRRRLIRRGCCCALLAALLAACGGTQTATVPTAVPTSAPAPTNAPTAGPTALPTPGPDEFANPVIDRDFPDPDVLKVGDTYYAYATNFGSTNIQTAKSTDLVQWELLGDALQFLPDWANYGLTWAPEVTTYDGGATFVMYFTARDKASDKQCIGVATSAAPEGPFTSQPSTPLICQADQGGSIDASSFADDNGTRYVLWKNDGNCCGMDTWLYIQPVSADGLQLQGEPTRLLKQDQAWEGNLVEAPTLWKHAGTYYLFYSANNYAGADYAIGYAVADTILGPYRKAEAPFLATSTDSGPVIGPGGQDIVVANDGTTWMVYHSWSPTIDYRSTSIARLDWNGDTPSLKAVSYRVPEARP